MVSEEEKHGRMGVLDGSNGLLRACFSTAIFDCAVWFDEIVDFSANKEA